MRPLVSTVKTSPSRTAHVPSVFRRLFRRAYTDSSFRSLSNKPCDSYPYPIARSMSATVSSYVTSTVIGALPVSGVCIKIRIWYAYSQSPSLMPTSIKLAALHATSILLESANFNHVHWNSALTRDSSAHTSSTVCTSCTPMKSSTLWDTPSLIFNRMLQTVQLQTSTIE